MRAWKARLPVVTTAAVSVLAGVCAWKARLPVEIIAKIIMKIVLFGNSPLAQIVAWGLGQSELASEIAFVAGTHATRARGNPEEFAKANALSGSDTAISFSSSVEGLSDADIVVMLPPMGQTAFRSVQAAKTTSLALARQVAPSVKELAPDAKVLVAMSPANYIAAWLHQAIGGNAQVIGLGNGAATAALIYEIAMQLGVSVKDVSALAIGNDAGTHPLPQYCRVNGIPLAQLMSADEVEQVIRSAKSCASSCAGSGYTLASHLLQVVSAIALDKKRVMSVGAPISAGVASVYLNVPAKIGSEGVEGIVPLALTEEQRELFKALVAQSAAEQV